MIQSQYVKVKFNKPACVGVCTLDLSKVLMYEFGYDYIKNKYCNKSILFFTNTDSLIYEIKMLYSLMMQTLMIYTPMLFHSLMMILALLLQALIILTLMIITLMKMILKLLLMLGWCNICKQPKACKKNDKELITIHGIQSHRTKLVLLLLLHYIEWNMTDMLSSLLCNIATSMKL